MTAFFIALCSFKIPYVVFGHVYRCKVERKRCRKPWWDKYIDSVDVNVQSLNSFYS